MLRQEGMISAVHRTEIRPITAGKELGWIDVI